MSVESDAVIALYVRLETAHMALHSAVAELCALANWESIIPEETVTCLGMANVSTERAMATLREIEPALALVASRLASKV